VFVHEQVLIIMSESACVHGSHTGHAEWAITEQPGVAHVIEMNDRTAFCYHEQFRLILNSEMSSS